MSKVVTHDVGDTLRFSARLYDAPGGALVNATAVALTILLPDGTTAGGVAVVNPPATVGTYFYDYVCGLPGRHVGRWTFTLAGGRSETYVERFDVAGVPTAAWPPLLAELRDDLGLAADDVRDDARLQIVLDAAVAVVERSLDGDYNFTGAVPVPPAPVLPAPPVNVRLGTVRYAGRWHNRRRSPEGLVDMGELGSARIPSFDPDIEALLGVGRHRPPMVG